MADLLQRAKDGRYSAIEVNRGLLDLVFIRNVMIYFSHETKKKILGRIRALMQPNGFLFLGGSETTLNLDDNFERLPSDNSGCYRIRPKSAIAA